MDLTNCKIVCKMDFLILSLAHAEELSCASLSVPVHRSAVPARVNSPHSKLPESFLSHPFPCQSPGVAGTQEFRGDTLVEGLACLVVVLQVLILDMELQAHSSATGGVEI